MSEHSKLSIYFWSDVRNQDVLAKEANASQFIITDPFRLWVIQLGVIITTATLLSLALRRIHQPMVIAEVLGGILLGPSALGRIPGFTECIFPLNSRPYLSLVANIGLCLFLFLVGIEIDSSVVKHNARPSATVALAGMILPFALGTGLSIPLYHQFIDPSIEYTHFMLFTGVAFSITAFPVLCRILTELKLLDTTVGIVVLSAGVGNDIVGWALLALSVALVNAGSALTALYILLKCIGWALFLLFPIRNLMLWLARKTGSIESGPTVLYMTLTILAVFGSAYLTEAIGVHAIFGAFVVGVIIPREGDLAISLAEKLEDMVSIIFLPLYFTLSGLSTNLGLLDDGVTWAYTLAIITLAFVGKFGGCTLAAKYGAGFEWREASAIGSLMSCKGLVELIVLNVGLESGILSQRVFSMFVLEALLLTFMTTPLVNMFYPPHLRARALPTAIKVANAEHRTNSNMKVTKESALFKSRFLVVLDKVESFPGMMAFTQLIQPNCVEADMPLPTVSINALRILELSDRASAVMKSTSTASDSLSHSDPLISVFRMFGVLNGWTGPVTTSVSTVPFDDMVPHVIEHAKSHLADMIILPWVPPPSYATAAADADDARGDEQATKPQYHLNPLGGLFKSSQGSNGSASDASTSMLYSQFVRGVFAQSSTDVALYIDQNASLPLPASSDGEPRLHQHLFVPFFGGPDDRLALEFVAQLCRTNEKLEATVVRVVKRESAHVTNSVGTLHNKGEREAEVLVRLDDEELGVLSANAGFPDTVYEHTDADITMQSETADDVIWNRFAGGAVRMHFAELSSATPLQAILQQARHLQRLPWSSATQAPNNQGLRYNRKTRLTVVVGRSKRLAMKFLKTELAAMSRCYDVERLNGVGVGKIVGDVAAAFVVGGCSDGLVVVQAALKKRAD